MGGGLPESGHPKGGPVTEPGAAIHRDHPFRTPADDRDQTRRLRGRLVCPVTVWTAGDGNGRAGLTVSSVLVAPGPEPLMFGLLDPDSDLYDVLTETGRGVVNVLRWRHRTVADVFAGTYPSPGGAFRTGDWTATPDGPALADAAASVRIAVRATAPAGWSELVTAAIESVSVTDDSGGGSGDDMDSSGEDQRNNGENPDEPRPSTSSDDGLAYLRGRYRTVSPVRGG